MDVVTTDKSQELPSPPMRNEANRLYEHWITVEDLEVAVPRRDRIPS